MNHAHFLRIKGLSQKSTSSKNRDLVMPRVIAHNVREIVAEIGVRAGSHIDPARIHHNIILRGLATSGAVSEAVQTMMQGVNVSKWRKDTISAIELVFSLPVLSTVPHVAYFSDAVMWAERFFQVPLISAVIHLDEDAPHCHAILIPIVNGKLCGSKVMGNNKRIAAMHDDFFAQVGKPYGIARPRPPKRYSAAIRREAIELARNVLKTNSGLHSGIVLALLEPHFNNPEPLLQSLGLAMPTPTTKETFASVMTKPVKPDKQELVRQTLKTKSIEVQKQTPIEVQPPNDAHKINLYPVLEVRLTEPIFISAIDESSEPINDDYMRERDNDNDASYWDETIGEFIKPLTKTRNKSPIEQAVNASLYSLKVSNERTRHEQSQQIK